MEDKSTPPNSTDNIDNDNQIVVIEEKLLKIESDIDTILNKTIENYCNNNDNSDSTGTDNSNSDVKLEVLPPPPIESESNDVLEKDSIDLPPPPVVLPEESVDKSNIVEPSASPSHDTNNSNNSTQSMEDVQSEEPKQQQQEEQDKPSTLDGFKESLKKEIFSFLGSAMKDLLTTTILSSQSSSSNLENDQNEKVQETEQVEDLNKPVSSDKDLDSLIDTFDLLGVGKETAKVDQEPLSTTIDSNSPISTTTTTTTTTNSNSTTVIPTTPIPQIKLKKTLKNFYEQGLIELSDKCFFVFKEIKCEVRMVLEGSTPYFVLDMPVANDKVVVIKEQSATTLIKKYLKEYNNLNEQAIAIPTALEGNKLLFIKDTLMDDYKFKQQDTTATPIPSADDLLKSPGIQTPYKPLPKASTASSSIQINSNVSYAFRNKSSKTTPSPSPIKIEYEVEKAKVRPSGVGRYFHFGCDRYLSFSTRSVSSTSVPVNPMGSIQQALVDDGFRWEEKVLEEMEARIAAEKSDIKIFKSTSPDSNDIPVNETLRILREEKGTFYIIQSTLDPPPTFKRNLAKSIGFSMSKPDYLLITTDSNGKREIEILDAKSTNKITFSQKIQLAFYYLLLNDIIAYHQIPDISVSYNAGIYLKGNYKPEPFSLKDPVSILSTFLFGDRTSSVSQLEKILSTPKQDSSWIVSERCDGCEYLEHCTKQAVAEKSLNSVSYLNQAIRNIVPPKSELGTVSEIEYLLALHDKVNEDNNNLKEIEPSLLSLYTTELIRALPKLKAVWNDSVEITNNFDVLLTSSVDLQVFINVVHEPCSQSPYQWGLMVIESDNKYLFNGQQFSDLVIKLADIYLDCDQKKSLQSFIFDAFQREYFLSNCFKLLKHSTLDSNQELQDKVLVVLRTLLNNNDWINFNIDYYPEIHLPRKAPVKTRQEDNSLILVQDLVKKIYALNINPIYTLEKIVDKLPCFKQGPQSNNENNTVTTTLPLNGNQMYEQFIKKQLDASVPINYQLECQRMIVNDLRAQVFNGENSKPASLFVIRPSSSFFKNQHMKHLYFCYQNETISSCRTIRNKRSNSLLLNQFEGVYSVLKLIEKVQKTPKTDLLTFVADIPKQNFPKFTNFFTKDITSFYITAVENEKHLSKINDNQFTMIKDKFIHSLSLVKESVSIIKENNLSYTISFQGKTPSCDLLLEKHFIFFEMFDIKYFQMHSTLMASYEEMDNDKDNAFLNILDNPLPWITDLKDQDKFLQSIKGVVESLKDASKDSVNKLTMTKSQMEIFDSFVKKRLQLVRGPPGTGKTHFLALLVLIFMEAYHRLEKPLRIAITSFTHTAINNLLQRISSLMKEYKTIIGQDPNFYLRKNQSTSKKDTPEFADDPMIEILDKKKDFNHKYLVVGSTSWGLATMKQEFDLLIVDEASQLSSFIGATVFNILSDNPLNGTEGGQDSFYSRVIVCGDQQQLGPVLNDQYSSKKDLVIKKDKLNPKLHKSIFSCLKSLFNQHIAKMYPDPSCTNRPVALLSLYENFRMNQELCQFSSSTLYGPLYQCFNPSQNTIKSLDITNHGSPITHSIFNSDRSIHTILLNDNYFGNKEVEAQIVKDIYEFLRIEYSNANNNSDQDEIENNFWNNSNVLGVITPLHEQRNLIIPSILSLQEKKWKLKNLVTPIVNTVEVTQGKEYDNVILCYNGFNLNNKISEFSFNLNRLNVGFTRAKKRFILIVSTQLLYPDEIIFNSHRMSKAYQHLFSYIQSSQIHEFDITKIQLNNPTITTDNSHSVDINNESNEINPKEEKDIIMDIKNEAITTIDTTIPTNDNTSNQNLLPQFENLSFK
ncbi:hypothetical protein CYY_005602 [Polysphondylium violaceum]|uniref:DNA2/NAM7 helicase-like C-terminal domain-containing protein n=1 Tax=Polysphondylium violaceum TaxID=133409 RepID=A0A8J4Q2R0_9MYCE|nr:hypothetical protein CYY_005602 [Polysphondylium violaceum]